MQTADIGEGLGARKYVTSFLINSFSQATKKTFGECGLTIFKFEIVWIRWLGKTESDVARHNVHYLQHTVTTRRRYIQNNWSFKSCIINDFSLTRLLLRYLLAKNQKLKNVSLSMAHIWNNKRCQLLLRIPISEQSKHKFRKNASNAKLVQVSALLEKNTQNKINTGWIAMVQFTFKLHLKWLKVKVFVRQLFLSTN